MITWYTSRLKVSLTIFSFFQMTKVNECYQDPTQKVPANSPTKFQKLPKFIGKRCLGNSRKAWNKQKNSTWLGGVKGDYDEKKF